MIFFRRRKSTADEAAGPALSDGGGPAASRPVSPPAGEEAPPADESTDLHGHGPWDVEEQPDLGQRVDVGSLRVPARQGMQMRMELEPKSRKIVAVNVMYQGTAVQLQAFAAPRKQGIWQELREEIVESIGEQGGSVEEREGSFGTELLARLPVRTKEGRTGLRPVRFLGIDGPRWFLRAVVSGKAAMDAEAGSDIDSILRDVVIVRGDAPRPPRERLPLHLPGKPGEESAPQPPSLNLDEGRGPEITEVG